MRNQKSNAHPEIRDYGNEPLIFNINHAALMNKNFRFALWSGRYMQLTLMCIAPHDEIGVEMHSDVDQFICIESGKGELYMGQAKSDLNDKSNKTIITDGYAVLIPAGAWHNIRNNGSRPLKLYSLYAPPQHPFGTIEKSRPIEPHNH